MVLLEPLDSNIGFDFFNYTKRIFMKKTVLILFLLAFTLYSPSIFAQRIVVIDPSTDLAKPKDIYPVIMGDTLTGGVRKDVNTNNKLKIILTETHINKNISNISVPCEAANANSSNAYAT